MQPDRALERRRRAGRPAGLALRRATHRLGVRAGQVPPPRGTSCRYPSRLSPRNASPSRGTAWRAVPQPCAQRSVADPLCMKVKDGRRTAGLMLGLYFDAKTRNRLAIKAAAGRQRARKPPVLPVRATGEQSLPANTAAGQRFP
jgi:hypothetical protein